MANTGRSAMTSCTKISCIERVRIKGSPDPIHFIVENNVGKRRIRHTTTLKFDFFLLKIQIQSRSRSDPTPSDIDQKMALV